MKITKDIIKYIGIFVILNIIYVMLLVIVNKIPSKILENNVKESADILLEEGELANINLLYKDEYVFNFTDTLMINMAYSVDSNKPLESTLLSRKNYMPGITKKQNTIPTTDIGLDSKYSEDEDKKDLYIKELYDFVNNKGVEESFEYARYWHGYMIWLRPLLAILNIGQIKTLFAIILILLTSILIYLLYKKINIITAIIFAIGLFSCSICAIGYSLGEISIYIIMLIFSILILQKKNYKNIGIMFFILGSLTSFMDILTSPLITVFIPITIYFLVIQKNKKESKKDCIKKYIWICLLWGIGYILTWFSKWIIVDILENRQILTQGILQIRERTIADFKYYKLIERILVMLSLNTIYVVLISTVLLILINIINKGKNKLDICLLPFGINAIMPFIWYLLVRNHSYIHPFYSYKILSITIINVLIIISNIRANIKEKKIL